jgi:hypothetical protein
MFNFHARKCNLSSSLMVIMALSLVVVLTGCNETAPAPDPVQTVSWYKEHDAERNAMIAKCNDNPGELAMTPNCMNAKKADFQKELARR